MDSKTILADKVTKLKDILSNQYHVPIYQREYDWEIAQCKELIDDLTRFIENKIDNNSKYVFGQIVAYNTDDNKRYILDGQQRLTTVSLYIAALRNIIRNNKAELESAEQDQIRRYISELERSLITYNDENNSFTLNFNPYVTNRKFYEELILNSQDPFELKAKAENSSQKNMVDNYIYFFDRFCDQIGIKKGNVWYNKDEFNVNPSVYLESIKAYRTLTNFIVCEIYTNHLVEAFDLFESINNRGIKLGNLDLLKNRVYSKCYDNDQSLDQDEYCVEKTWESAIQNLKKIKSEDKVLRWYVNATYKFTRKNDLFQSLRNITTTKQASLAFVKNFEKASYFIKLILDDKFKDRTISDESKRILKGLNIFKFEVYIPVVTSVYLKNYNEPDLTLKLNQILRAFDHLCIFCIMTGYKKTASMEEKLSNLATKYYEDDFDFDQLLDSIYRENDASGNVILNYLEKTLYTTNDRAKYILSEIYNRTSDTKISISDVDLEHILPKDFNSAKDNWPQFNEDEHRLNVYKIGNLVLLNKNTNRSIKSKPFNVKLEKYKNKIDGGSRTVYVDNYPEYFDKMDWTPVEIDERSKFINEQIIELWSRPR